ncbi:hypothetical protein K469DRAFT_702363 [Zopfia rhizophila CBS 207.26]|uniref:Uncharacterized protein n=1 Tax=Zopfia rhizophila CBS 207.26 TaxID=1314779 RepID=A0A6A6D7E5_9PEZI|nr:hypothetical protein K469DRAFT_702363 [Zopfia rhizophila CBS 207.26]
MATGITKIRTKDSDDNNLVEEFKKQTDCGDCTTPTWISPQNRTRIYPPDNTAAIVVDVRNNKGAVNIHKKDSSEFVDMVGTEESGKLVIVPWNNSWFYYSVGSLKVGYIAKQ